MADPTWLAAVEARGFDGPTRAMLVAEAQRTRFSGDLPAKFSFLRGTFVDLGFDRLGLSDGELDAVRKAFVGAGVRVPGTVCRLRFVRPVLSVIEPADGTEAATLPARWRQGVVVQGWDESLTWVGKATPQGWLARVDLRGYEDAGDGWVRAVPISNSGGGGGGHA